MTIYLTGDIHGSMETNRLSSTNWPQGRNLNRDDYLIILGDFGLIFDPDGESRSERYWLNWLDDKPWTTLFIDGNHENFDRLFSDEFEIAPWHGGYARFIRPNVIHLLRGEIYDIDDTTFLAFGGANSVDRDWRIEGESWWAQEVPSDEDRQHCVSNLIAAGDQVDVVLTHEAPSAAYYSTLLGKCDYSPDNISNWLQSNIADTVNFKRWYFGHHHIDVSDAYPYTALYQEIVELDLYGNSRFNEDGEASADYEAVWNNNYFD